VNLKDCAHRPLNKTQVCGTCEPPPGWQHHALCTLGPFDEMYPIDQDEIAIIKCKTICARCPVRGYCLELGWFEDWGIWAGFTPQERKRLRKIFSLVNKTKEEIRLMIRTIGHRL